MNNNEDLLQDLEVNLVKASTGKRFANYLIDIFIFYLFAFIVAIIWGIIDPEILESIDSMDGITSRLISLIFYGIFMGIYEGLFKGRTLGKLITGTKAVNLDGSTISFKTAMTRGISRSVPFEAFTGFGENMWHDKWADSYVISIKDSTLPS